VRGTVALCRSIGRERKKQVIGKAATYDKTPQVWSRTNWLEALKNGSRWRVVVAGEWQALENVRRWRIVGAGEWQSLENGSRWRMVVAGDWESLENGSRWRLGVARNRAPIACRRALAGIQPSTVTTSLLDFDSNNDSSGAPMCSSSS
jgi:hypothetical protein